MNERMESKQNKDYRKLLGEKLQDADRAAAEQSPDCGPFLTDEKKQKLLAAAEERKHQLAREKARKRRKIILAAAVCAAVVFVFTGVAAGLFDFDFDLHATATPEDKRNVVQAGNDIVIGDADEGVEYSGVYVVEYAGIEDIPEYIREKTHYIDELPYEVEKVRVQIGDNAWIIDTFYYVDNNNIIVTETYKMNLDTSSPNVKMADFWKKIKGLEVYTQQVYSDICSYVFNIENSTINVQTGNDLSASKIEAIINDLLKN